MTEHAVWVTSKDVNKAKEKNQSTKKKFFES